MSNGNTEFRNKSNDGKLIQWAGTLHQRQHFNKKRDDMANWAEVLFHN